MKERQAKGREERICKETPLGPCARRKPELSSSQGENEEEKRKEEKSPNQMKKQEKRKGKKSVSFVRCERPSHVAPLLFVIFSRGKRTFESSKQS